MEPCGASRLTNVRDRAPVQLRGEEDMVRTIIIIGCLSFAVALDCNAQDGDLVGQLEKEIQEIKARLSRLEALLGNPSKVQELVPSGDGWKSVVNWRKVTTGMGASDVQKILGEPHRVEGGRFASLYYQNGGRIFFYEGKVDRWIEPRQ